MLEPKLKDIYSQETSTWWKGHNNRIWLQTKDDVMMELDRILFLEYKSIKWNVPVLVAKVQLSITRQYKRCYYDASHSQGTKIKGVFLNLAYITILDLTWKVLIYLNTNKVSNDPVFFYLFIYLFVLNLGWYFKFGHFLYLYSTCQALETSCIDLSKSYCLILLYFSI